MHNVSCEIILGISVLRYQKLIKFVKLKTRNVYHCSM